jgi:hypothetical protein
LRIVWYVFFTAVLPSRFGNPILRNQAEPPFNFQLWLGHPPAAFADVQAFCAGRTHNLWGSTRNEDNPRLPLHYDIAPWMRSQLSAPLSQYKFTKPVVHEFGFSDAKKEEMAALIQRYGTTTTGIGRIIIQMGRSRIWRDPVTLSGCASPAMTATSPTSETASYSFPTPQ